MKPSRPDRVTCCEGSSKKFCSVSCVPSNILPSGSLKRRDRDKSMKLSATNSSTTGPTTSSNTVTGRGLLAGLPNTALPFVSTASASGKDKRQLAEESHSSSNLIVFRSSVLSTTEMATEFSVVLREVDRGVYTRELLDAFRKDTSEELKDETATALEKNMVSSPLVRLNCAEVIIGRLLSAKRVSTARPSLLLTSSMKKPAVS